MKTEKQDPFRSSLASKVGYARLTTKMTAIQTRVMNRRGALALATALVAGGRTRSAAAEPIPKTWTYAGNAARTGIYPGPGLDLTQDIIELWRIDGRQTGILVDACGVCDGIAYYVAIPNGISDIPPSVIAVDARTGTELWRHDPPETTPQTFFWGELAIADGLVVAPTHAGLLAGLDARTGEERWIFDLQGTSEQLRPAIVDGVLYVGDATSVNALKLSDTPEWLWKSSLGDGLTTIVNGTVSVDGDYVVASSLRPADNSSDPALKATYIHVLNRADGSELHRHGFHGGGETYQIAMQNGVLYSRADKMFMERSYVFSLSIDGTEQWSSRIATAQVAYPAVQGNRVYLIGGDGVWGLDSATGERVWTWQQPQALDTNIVLIDDVIYIGSAPPTSMIFAISAMDGTSLKSIDMPFNGAEVIGVTDGVLIARSGMGLIAFANPS